ncbi:zinc ribbon domain-containing protein [Geminicoccaceae bacterium 1502E]|nr:zinc ribbon domain-containing protein [Geminicoccaceae bacterium 1502E]
MPAYDYDCQTCGAFTELRPMSESASPADCPACGVAAPRVIRPVHIRGQRSATRYALEARNERSANEPKVVRHVGRKNADLEKHGHQHHRNRLDAHAHAHGHAHTPHRPWMVGH